MMNWIARLSEKQKDLFVIFFIISIFLLRFFKTIFFAQPISKIFLAAHWDSLFYNLRSGQNISMDPSLVQVFLPYKFLVSAYWHHGFPLWNQWSGFGMPLLADPQSRVFSPLSIGMILFTSLASWNFLLIVQLVIGAISTYYLCRELELDFIAGFIAAISFAFCPWLDWQLELMGKGICFTPFVFFFFSRLAKNGSFRNIVLAGITAAIEIFSCHPEIAFVTLFSASMFTCLLTCYINPQDSLFSSLRIAIRNIALAAFIAFGLCAPMFIPFLEYVINADSYKLDVVASIGLPWQAVFANYLFPFQSAKGSIFFGILSLLGIPATFCFAKYLNRFAKPLIIGFVVSIFAVARPFPFEFFFKIPPFSMTFATYWLPEYFLFISLLTGLGCSYLVKNGPLKKSFSTLAFLAIVLALILLPLLSLPWHNYYQAIVFDNTFASPKFNFKVWTFNTICLISILLVLFTTRNKPPFWKTIGLLLFISIGLLNSLITSFNSLPTRPDFKYPQTLPLNLDTKNISRTDRILSIGNHIFKPNTNLIYRLPLLAVANPIFPQGFIDFTKACGAQTDQYTQIFSPVINPLLRLAGVNTIISDQPILDESVLTNWTPNSSKVIYNNSLALTNIKLLYSQKEHALFFVAQAIPDKKANSNYHLCLSIEDTSGHSISYSEPAQISLCDGPQRIMCSGLLPENIKQWTASIRVMQDSDFSFLSPQSIPYGKILNDKSWLITNLDESRYITHINNDRFELIARQNSLLRYKDKTAFNRYFFIENISWAANRHEALNYLTTHSNDWQNSAVLEEKQKDQFLQLLRTTLPAVVDSASGAIHFDKFSTAQLNSSTEDYSPDVSLTVKANSPAFLVASDIYYPGWQVYIDEKQSKIFRTDSLFRGVVIPAGKHIVKFVYQPLSVALGLFLFILTIAGIFVAWLFLKLPKKIYPQSMNSLKQTTSA